MPFLKRATDVLRTIRIPSSRAGGARVGYDESSTHRFEPQKGPVEISNMQKMLTIKTILI